jgi:hypothetical protein
LQALAGEFVFHCHIPQHYVTGMWGFWRVYNTLQAPGSQTDVMKPLVELPDRKGKVKLAVSSDKLVGTTVDWYGGKKYEITKDKTDWKSRESVDHGLGRIHVAAARIARQDRRSGEAGPGE